ncbi:hypothetical protein LCGC14_3163850 [marine sediment metagenome]|uniref:Uncharacterized protein n=1 Tax=marine sediment metagenome TaxID=412755 RepID=A0A0F8VQE8_9ZZZZ
MAFVKAATLYGKAKDIEKKHEEAELWAKRAEHDYAEREEMLVAGEKKLARDARTRRKARAYTGHWTGRCRVLPGRTT